VIDLGPVPDGAPPAVASEMGHLAAALDEAGERGRDAATARLGAQLPGIDLGRLRGDVGGAGLWQGRVDLAAAGLPDLEGLDRLLAGLPVDPGRLVLTRDRSNVDLGVVAAPFRVRPGAPLLVNPARLLGALGEGVTAQVLHLDELDPGLGALCADLERVFLGRAKVDAFLSHGSVSALGPHFDNPELLIVQLHGAKHWRFHRPDVANPQRGLVDEVHLAEAGRRHPAGEVDLAPGDAVYLPQGWWHEASASGPSAHLTFGIARPVANEAVDRLVRWGRYEDAGLRAPVDDRWGQDELGDVLERLAGAAGAERWSRWARGTMPPRSRAGLADLWALRSGPVPPVEVRSACPGGIVPVAEREAEVTVWLGGTQLTVDGPAVAALTRLAEGDWCAVEALGDDPWPLLGTLLTEGLLDLRRA
jgi:hypothetical protein